MGGGYKKEVKYRLIAKKNECAIKKEKKKEKKYLG